MDFMEVLSDMLGVSQDFAITNIVKDDIAKTIKVHLVYRKSKHLLNGISHSIYDYTEEREWQHLRWFEYRCYIVCRLPRYLDQESKPKVIEPVFAEKNTRYTKAFARQVLETLGQIQNQSLVARLLGTTSYVVRRVMETAVSYGLAHQRLNSVEHISIDEKSFSKGHHYTSILVDASRSQIIDMVEKRDAESTRKLFYEAGEEGKSNHTIKAIFRSIKQVNIDMWAPYRQVIEEIAPSATIVYDKFHLFSKLSDAINHTRKAEVKHEPLLRKQRFTMLKNAENRTEKQELAFQAIDASNLKTAKAWHVRENFKSVFTETRHAPEQAERLYNAWVSVSKAVNLPAVSRVIATFERHKDGILNAMITKTSSGKHESLNGRIQSLLSKARGFLNFERLKVNLMFYFGGLDLRIP